jgi:hypothetical protein
VVEFRAQVRVVAAVPAFSVVQQHDVQGNEAIREANLAVCIVRRRSDVSRRTESAGLLEELSAVGAEPSAVRLASIRSGSWSGLASVARVGVTAVHRRGTTPSDEGVSRCG